MKIRSSPGPASPHGQSPIQRGTAAPWPPSESAGASCGAVLAPLCQCARDTGALWKPLPGPGLGVLEDVLGPVASRWGRLRAVSPSPELP